MEDVKTTARLKFWPTPQDYNEALQNPSHAFSDPELQAGRARTDALGLPRPVSGAFASVYQLETGTSEWAVRCFLRNADGQAERYRLISHFVQNDQLPYTVGFEFQPMGILISGCHFPLLKMQWVDGLTLDKYIERSLGSPQLLLSAAQKFKTMCADLQVAGMAHGDLQHGNIMVSNEDLYLVDYDNMFVPGMNALSSQELGHRSYQHPKRSAGDFGAYLDNFSAWVIYISLFALGIDPSLYDLLGGGDDCLLFRQEDFLDPQNSCAFYRLEQSSDPQVAQMAKFLRAQLAVAVAMVPPLSNPMNTIAELPPFSTAVPKTREQAKNARIQSQRPDWLNDLTAGILTDPNGEFHPAGSESPRHHGTGRRVSASQKNAFSSWANNNHHQTTQAFPQELLQPTPRKNYTDNEGCMRISPWVRQFMAAIPLIIGLVALICGLQHDVALATQTRLVQAEITKIQYKDNSGSVNGYYDVTYSFPMNGTVWTGHQAVNLETGNRLKEHQKVPVEAIASDPMDHSVGLDGSLPALDSGAKQRLGTDATWLLIFAALSLTAEFCLWYHPIVHRNLVRNGFPVWGKLERKATITTRTGGTAYCLEYTFDPGRYGPQRVRKTVRVTKDQFYRYREGDDMIILFDPLSIGNSVPYELCFYHPV